MTYLLIPSYTHTLLDMLLEQVMGSPVARRGSTKPVLKSGHKWPCFTMHRTPSLHPNQHLADAGALQALQGALEELELEFPRLTLKQQASQQAAQLAAQPAQKRKKPMKLGENSKLHAARPGIASTRPAAPKAAAPKAPSARHVVPGVRAPLAPAPISAPISSSSTLGAVPTSSSPLKGSASDPIREKGELPRSKPTAAPSSVGHLKRGAADLKRHLLEAQGRKVPVAVAWLQSGAEDDSEFTSDLRAAADEAFAVRGRFAGGRVHGCYR